MIGILFLIASPFIAILNLINAAVFLLFWECFGINKCFVNLVGAEHVPERFINPSYWTVYGIFWVLAVIYWFFWPSASSSAQKEIITQWQKKD